MSVIILIGVVLGFRKDSGASFENADIQVTKTANPNSVQPGKTITYTIQITNNTDSDITGTFADNTTGSTKLLSATGPVKMDNPISDYSFTGTVTVPAGKTITETIYAVANNDAASNSEIINSAEFKNADYHVSSDKTTVTVIPKPYPVS
jgi:hypothetical protein